MSAPPVYNPFGVTAATVNVNMGSSAKKKRNSGIGDALGLGAGMGTAAGGGSRGTGSMLGYGKGIGTAAGKGNGGIGNMLGYGKGIGTAAGKGGGEGGGMYGGAPGGPDYDSMFNEMPGSSMSPFPKVTKENDKKAWQKKVKMGADYKESRPKGQAETISTKEGTQEVASLQKQTDLGGPLFRSLAPSSYAKRRARSPLSGLLG